MKSLTSIFLVQLACLPLFLPISQCSSVVLPMDAKLIDQTCRKTPDYNLCVQSIKLDPRSSGADVVGLAIIIIDAVGHKATITMNKINELLKQTPGNQALVDCSNEYAQIIDDFVPTSKFTVNSGTYSVAKAFMKITPKNALSCEQSFKGRSPLTNLNNDLIKVANVAEAVAVQLPN